MTNAIYGDTSALLKLYAPEPDSSDYLRLLIQQSEDVAISFLQRVERYFALRGKRDRILGIDEPAGGNHRLQRETHQATRRTMTRALVHLGHQQSFKKLDLIVSSQNARLNHPMVPLDADSPKRMRHQRIRSPDAHGRR